MSTPADMTVIEIAAPGGPEQLKLAQRPVPRPGDEEVLVRVAAAGVNRPDVMQRQGRYPAPPGASDLPGLEIAQQSLQVSVAQKSSRKKLFHLSQAACGFHQKVAGFAHRALSLLRRAAACKAPLGVSSCLM